jgi:hypothetical protein
MTKLLKIRYWLVGFLLLSFGILAILAIFVFQRTPTPNTTPAVTSTPTFAPTVIPTLAFKQKPGLFLVGGIFKEAGSRWEPLLLFFDPDKFSIDRVDLKKLPNINFELITEIRPFMINGKYKLAVGTRAPGKILIFGDIDTSWNNLKIEFEEELEQDELLRTLYAGDIDNDGIEEIVVGTRPKGILKYYKYINNQWIGKTIDTINATIHDLVIADSDENSLNEIIITASLVKSQLSKSVPPKFTPEILKYEFNKDKWNKKTISEFTEEKIRKGGIIDYARARYLFFENFDEDGKKEIVANMLKGNLIEFKKQGNSYFQSIIENTMQLSKDVVAIGDIDDDGKSEIIATTKTTDTLLLYEYEKGKWTRSILAEDLIDKNENIVAVTKVGYKKILYVVSDRITPDGPNGTTHFYILEYQPQKNIWEKKSVAEQEIQVDAWGIFPAFPKK